MRFEEVSRVRTDEGREQASRRARRALARSACLLAVLTLGGCAVGPKFVKPEVALNPVWSPLGDLIAYIGANVSAYAPLLAVRPDGTPVKMPAISMRRDGERLRFTRDGRALIYMQGAARAQDFWMLNLETMQTRQLTRLTRRDSMRTFDIMPDGKRIVFDRLRDNSDIVLIDLPRPTR